MFRFFSDFVRYWPLTVRLARSQFALRYRQSILGVSWAVLQPLFEMVVFTFVLHKGASVPSEPGTPYPLFVFCALLFWKLFSSSLSLGVPCLVQFANVLRKVYVPRETFPLSSIATSFFDFGLAGIVFALLLAYFRWPLHLAALWTIPLLALQVVYMAGLLFFGSALCVKYRDIRHGVVFGIYMWMFVSPVIVPMSKLVAGMARRDPRLPWVYYFLNPIGVYLDGFRRAILHGQAPDWSALAVAAAGTLVLFVFGYAYFKRKEMTFADII
jgi:ABC-type polysaccharide/polyol phosphate export permease